ncbi:MAG TPA: phosphate ABC transporter permease subunit PstC [candidate division Zixibacteria bacterium]|nr:phosphate ABC transporter permease subunit PstC [candidate division Zixibacteria bacterium]MDD4917925.1 phosphate ABC transporter permease subunit PstC [candidate division Zixibacteria bacterium]MDM7972523.1 phosphate ABC transporter permease subunit PstC [candidate division Zixibacteria bacterium]HOD65222.1 phosphate ABC transporter permease subunit PstC [candidate division Zixibacteria bacterium]HPC11100.1 phosphate ABC transporter permease subunit PstC [candidate division Zixibacteria bac
MQPYQFRPKSKIREFLGERLIQVTALTALVSVALIFIFIFKEAVPIFTDESVREEVTLEKMVVKQEWKAGREASCKWQPESGTPKYSLLPLFVGTLKAALIAMLFAVPLGVGAAIYSAEFASRRLREFIKPVVELLAGIPSVVLGFFALLVLATVVQNALGLTYRLNAITAGLALGLAVIPIVFTVAEDAMTSVPQSLRDAALALGANRWQVSRTVVLPAALPGIAAGVILGFGRAIGETMIVLMASGNAAVVSLAPGDSVRTLSATIAAELAEVVFGSAHYSVLFLLGTLLFVFTFLINLGGDVALRRIRTRLQGRTS